MRESPVHWNKTAGHGGQPKGSQADTQTATRCYFPTTRTACTLELDRFCGKYFHKVVTYMIIKSMIYATFLLLSLNKTFPLAWICGCSTLHCFIDCLYKIITMCTLCIHYVYIYLLEFGHDACTAWFFLCFVCWEEPSFFTQQTRCRLSVGESYLVPC